MSVVQSQIAECGLACLAIADQALGGPTTLADLRRRHPVSARGMTLEEVKAVAATMNLACRAVRCTLDELSEIRTPAILHWGMAHYVVLKKAGRRSVVIEDPAIGLRTLDWPTVSGHFTGVAMELVPAPGYRKQKPKRELSIWGLLRWDRHFVSGACQVLLLSLLVQLYVLASPLFARIAIDEAAASGDAPLLTILALAFGAFALFNAMAELARGFAVQRMSALIGWDMTVRMYQHLIRLPLPWFQTRRLSDVLLRFDSIDPIRQLFSSGIIAVVIDGALVITVFAMMLFFMWQLALIALASFLLYLIVRIVCFKLTMTAAAEAILASVHEQGKRIETIQAIQSIKSHGAESLQEGYWARLYADVVRTSQRSAHIGIVVKAAQGGLEAISLVLIVYVGASAIMDNTSSIGVVFGFMSYRQQFNARLSNVLDTYLNFRMLDLHADRLAEIALAGRDQSYGRRGHGEPELVGAVGVADVHFSYGGSAALPVLRGASLQVASGEFLAIVGPSGCGKSTLLKIMAGLYEPTKGGVFYDGKSDHAFSNDAIRRSIGTVLQEDRLLNGSIADNVCFFDDQADMSRVWEALGHAGFRDELKTFPMGIDTQVGDLGAALSAGQIQRVLLARALYKKPRILLLDEATSHLDTASEALINAALQRMAITRVVVAHRPETIAAANRVVRLHGGVILPVRTGDLSSATDLLVGR